MMPPLAQTGLDLNLEDESVYTVNSRRTTAYSIPFYRDGVISKKKKQDFLFFFHAEPTDRTEIILRSQSKSKNVLINIL